MDIVRLKLCVQGGQTEHIRGWPGTALTLGAACQADSLSKAMNVANRETVPHSALSFSEMLGPCDNTYFYSIDCGFTLINTGPYPRKYYVDVLKRLIWVIK